LPLQSAFWSSDARLQLAVRNSPSLKAFDPNKPAVMLFQKSLVDTGIQPETKVDGIYGNQTAKGARAVENRFNMTKDQGAAGEQVLGILDILLQNGTLGAELAILDAPLAHRRVTRALAALVLTRQNRAAGGAPSQLVVDAMLTHFRLSFAPSTTGVGRPITDADLDLIIRTYTSVQGLLSNPAGRSQTGVPVNGIATAAEAPLGGPIRFGPAYANRDNTWDGFIGKDSRAAVFIHEAVHVFDRISGDDAIHISEFDPAYRVQSADNSMHNPSSYAGFAAHIDVGRDPVPPFGLGPGSRGLGGQ
jgi:hypothetical protein